jgi:DNA-3-methyladenine glycosylase II
VSCLEVVITPVPPFRLDLTAWALRRRPNNLVDRWDGQVYRRVMVLGDRPVELEVSQSGFTESAPVHVTVTGIRPGSAIEPTVRAVVERMLGLQVNLEEFYQKVAGDRRLDALVTRFRGVKPPRFPTIFECLINAFACQQVSLTVGIILLNRLVEHCGVAFGRGRARGHGFPRPVDLVDFPPHRIRRLGFSRQKARAIVELARAVDLGHAPLEQVADFDDETAVTQLKALRGVGRWSAEYVLLRGLGRLHVFPVDDVGARNNLGRLLGVRKPLDAERARRVLAGWQPHAGLIYFHLLLSHLAGLGLLA